MNKTSSREIRQKFIDYFKKNGHEPVASSSLVPENDATLLFANAGMNQFKDCFLGADKRSYSRAVTSQKCVRAGGKHNDLENVGFTTRHHTFFEMLGNFSFGDYFKKDAIHFAWDLLTKELAIPKDRLYVTVFQDDDEAADIWHKQEGVPRERIYKFGEKDNFWRMGDVGPCGPCTEIFFDHGIDVDPDPSKPSQMGGDGDRFVEIWNLVFMQFFEDGKGGRTKLPKPSVDTGGGLERWSAVLNGTHVNYDTDLFMPIINKAVEISGQRYINNHRELAKNKQALEISSAMRVVADHSRATAFLMADGVVPSNEGRGYVLRRIMRRAIRFAKKLSPEASLFEQTVAVVVSEMQAIYPELLPARTQILQMVKDEISRFSATLDQGTEILRDTFAQLKSKGRSQLDGPTVFKLYDTYGFPLDLTRLMAQENQFAIDEKGFEEQMETARQKAKGASRFKSAGADATHLATIAGPTKEKNGPTKFFGYSSLAGEATLLALSDGTKEVRELSAGQTGIAVFDQTPFYAEGGGQVGDSGQIGSGPVQAEVADCSKNSDIFFHHLSVKAGKLIVGSKYTLQVTGLDRRATAANHSATHLMHAALRKLLGTHVAQAGSLVTMEKLRFDFSHTKPMSEGEIEAVERLVNEEIELGRSVEANEMTHKEAIATGALALFGEKYGDKVRVIRMGDFSCELCGGTHVSNTSQIRLFKITSESGVSAGVRRIEATTGDGALRVLVSSNKENLLARKSVGINPEGSLVDWVDAAKNQIRSLEKQLKESKSTAVDIDALVRGAISFGDIKLVCADLDVDDRDTLAKVTDQLRDKAGNSVVVAIGKGEASHPVIVSVAKSLVAKHNAGKLLGEIAKVMGGKGGGRSDFAQGMIPDRSKIQEAFALAKKLLS